MHVFHLDGSRCTPQIGRRNGFVVTLTLLIVCSIMSALSFSINGSVLGILAFWRFLLGIGIGGEYPLSATIASENSVAHSRGRTTSLVFSMQGIGMLLVSLHIVLYVLHGLLCS